MRRRTAAAVVALALVATGCRHHRPAPRPAAVVTVPIAGRPSGVTVAGGLVWVADDERGTVVTVDEKSGRPVDEPIKVGPSPIAIAADESSVWVADASGTLTRIDAATRQVAGAPLPLGGVLSGVATGGGAVWVTDNEHGTLVRVDAATGAASTPLAMPQGAVRVAVDGQTVWVTNGENTVTPVDASSLAVGTPVAVGVGPIGVAARLGVAWVANSEDDTVSRAAAAASGPSPATRVAKAPVAVSADGDGTWVISQDARRLTRLDGATGQVVRARAIATRARGMALGAERVWIAGVEPNVVIGVLRSALGA